MSSRKSDQDQWLAEAAAALAEAERLIGALAFVRPRRDLDLASLQAEIMTVRAEIEQLRRRRTGGNPRDVYPTWLEYSLWSKAQ